jgi:2-methylcitrate dehydratase
VGTRREAERATGADEAQPMAEVHDLAGYVTGVRYPDIPAPTREELKRRILDSLGCALAALEAEPVTMARAVVDDLGGAGHATLIGGGRTAPDRAAFWNGALVRYLDFMDSYLAKGETCHPSDNLAPVLAAAEYAGADGATFLSALAVAYQVHARLSDEAPVRHKGFDHTTQGAYAVAAGVAKALGLDARRTANAIAISGTGNVALRVTRTGALSHWKGLAYPNTAFIATHAAFLAARGLTGPAEVFEGNKGFKWSIAGDFTIDWRSEDVARVHDTIIKKYNAEIHAQSALEAAIALKEEHGLEPAAITGIEVAIFDVAHQIIVGGQEGAKAQVATKEEADHSLPWLIACALVHGDVLPRHYEGDGVGEPVIQELLAKVTVVPSAAYSARFPSEMATTVTIHRTDGGPVALERVDYEGFTTRPMSWQAVGAKFTKLAEPKVGAAAARRVVDVVRTLEERPIGDLATALAACRPTSMAGENDTTFT